VPIINGGGLPMQEQGTNNAPDSGGQQSGPGVSINPEDPGAVTLIYILYLVGLVIGLSTLIGVVIAYINKDNAPEWLKSHYIHQIHTFWKWLLFIVVGALTAVFAIGVVILLGAYVWMVIRCVKGLTMVSRGQPHPEPRGWWI
jgi:uncharacterized membrane protein